MKVEIWSDIVCPWCYIGKRHFEAALEQFEHRDSAELIWRSFELDRQAPVSGLVDGDYVPRLAAKYSVPLEQAQQMIDQMTRTAAKAGLEFRFDLSKPGNTFDAHRLLHFAREQGRQDDLKEAFDSATFSRGLSVSNHDQLTAVAAGIGLNEADVRGILSTNAYADAVREDEAAAQSYQITGVPFFVIDGKFGVSGAQPADTLLRALNKAWEKQDALPERR